MKISHYLFMSLYFILGKNTISQTIHFGDALDCNVNVNAYMGSNDIKRAVFKYTILPEEWYCTGTLINRNAPLNQLGQYFITSWHCFKTGLLLCTGQEILDNNDETDAFFYFNYQSPDADDASTPEDNRGVGDMPSYYYHYDPNPNVSGQNSDIGPNTATGNDNAYRYFFRSKIKLVEKIACVWGDFALCQIVDPIPPHFNVYYAGWNPDPFLKILEGPFRGIHHPTDDIKKISIASSIGLTTSSVSTGCHVVTKLIDFLFGWIWGHQWVTEVICTYTDIPWYSVLWSQGIIEFGSSGSSLFNNNGRIIGNLSYQLSPVSSCLQPPGGTFYGKFCNHYQRAAIKNVLNPPASPQTWWTDQVGIDGRSINCYETLTNLNGEYYPLTDYQLTDHLLVLRSASNITVDTDPAQRLLIYDGAAVKFETAGIIDVQGNFDVQEGAMFDTEGIIPCNFTTYQKKEENPLLDLINSIDLPKYKELSIPMKNDSIPDDGTFFDYYVYPNPTRSFVTVFLTDGKAGSQKTDLLIYDSFGRLISEQKEITEPMIRIDMTNTSKGVYTLKIITENYTTVKKIIHQ